MGAETERAWALSDTFGLTFEDIELLYVVQGLPIEEPALLSESVLCTAGIPISILEPRKDKPATLQYCQDIPAGHYIV